MSKRILLTGIGGFLGSHILEEILVSTDWEVVGIASWHHQGVPERISDSIHYQHNRHRVTVITHDLAARINPSTINRIGRIDYIINAASESHVDRSIADPVPFIHNNVAVALNMLEYARVVRPQAFIQISTDEVYGAAPEGYSHKEWDALIPSNPYSASKAAQEAIAISYWRTYNVPVIITNTMNLIGERQDPEKFLPKIIQKVVRGETLTIHATPEGKPGSRHYIHCRNQANALLWLLKHRPPKLYPEADRPDRYHVAGQEEIDNLELAKRVAEIVGKPLNYELVDFHSSRPGHDPRYSLDSTKLLSLGWTYPIPFDESLRRTVEWTLERPEWLN